MFSIILSPINSALINLPTETDNKLKWLNSLFLEWILWNNNGYFIWDFPANISADECDRGGF